MNLHEISGAAFHSLNLVSEGESYKLIRDYLEIAGGHIERKALAQVARLVEDINAQLVEASVTLVIESDGGLYAHVIHERQPVIQESSEEVTK